MNRNWYLRLGRGHFNDTTSGRGASTGESALGRASSGVLIADAVGATPNPMEIHRGGKKKTGSR